MPETLGLKLLFLFSAHLAAASGQCLQPKEPKDWQSHYSQQLGLCLYSQLFSRSRTSYSEAAELCNSSVISSTGVARLVRADSEAKRLYLFNYLLSRSFGYTALWTEAVCDITTSKFQWSNGHQITGLTCNHTIQRVFMSASLSSTSTFNSELLVDPNGSVSKFVPVCEYEVPRCDPSSVPGYSNSSMSLSARPYINQTVRFNCAPGYYRQSEVQLTDRSFVASSSTGSAKSSEIAERHRYFCQFTPDPKNPYGGTSSFVQIGAPLELESCEPIHCKGWQLLNVTQIPDAEDTYKSSVVAAKMYSFGEKVPVQCQLGYVSYYDDTSTNTTVECGQSDLNPSLGMWMPPSLSVCSALHCKSPMPFFDPDLMLAYKAYDRSKDRSYSAVESNRFPFYPNVVSIRCRLSGYFFMDRKYDKSLQCALPGNGSRNVGVWTPVDGTILSSDVMGCKPITCLTNEIVIPAQQSDLPRALADSNLNDTMTVTDPVTGAQRNLSIRQFSQEFDMSYNTRVRVYCQYNYEMNVLNTDTGRFEIVTTYAVSCASSGTWSSKISACIKRTESIVMTGGKKYTPPAKEASGAQSLGVVVIVILIVFFTTIIVLDLTTITRDVRLMRRNVGRIRVRWRLGRKTA